MDDDDDGVCNGGNDFFQHRPYAHCSKFLHFICKCFLTP